jgi:hypothetical protein
LVRNCVQVLFFFLDPWIEDPVYGDNEEEADEVFFSFYFDCNYAGKTK